MSAEFEEGQGQQESRPKRLRLAGMAMMNGLLVHGPEHWAAASRTRDGRIEVRSGRKPRLGGPLLRVPGLRGLLRLGEGLLVVPLARARLRSARLPLESPRFFAALVLASVVANFARKRFGHSLRRELAVTLGSLAPAVLAIHSTDLAAYHGAEHKAIGAYEQGLPTARDATKEHERCGSNLMAPMIFSSLAGNAALMRLSEHPTPMQQAAVSLAGAAVAIEIFIWAEKNHDHGLAHAIRRPGIALQRWFVTREPTPDQLEVARAALEEILRLESAPDVDDR